MMFDPSWNSQMYQIEREKVTADIAAALRERLVYVREPNTDIIYASDSAITDLARDLAEHAVKALEGK